MPEKCIIDLQLWSSYSPVPIFCCHCSVYGNLTGVPLSAPRTRHKVSPLWLVQSGVGLVGSCLNTGVLAISYKERTSLVPAVNIMLG